MSLVTDAVHAKGGLIVNQIWHTGRFSHSSLQPDGKAPFGPSAIPIKGEHKTREGELVPYETPRDRGIRSPASSGTSRGLPSTRRRLASMAWRSTARTDI